MSSARNGGTTTAVLGVRSFMPITPLGVLYVGAGVRTVNPGPDFQITAASGASFTVSLNGAQTVQDVISRINAASGTAGVAAVWCRKRPRGNDSTTTLARVQRKSLRIDDLDAHVRRGNRDDDRPLA